MSGRLLDLLKIRWVPVEVFWAVSALAVAALIVQITGKGVDVLALMALGATIVLLDNALGDKCTEVVGPTLWSAVVLGIALLGGYGLVKKNGTADRFFRSAERAGYDTLYYDSSEKPMTNAAAVETHPTVVDTEKPKTSGVESAAHVAPVAQASTAAGATSGTAGLGTIAKGPTLRPWRKDVKKPVLRIEAPEIGTTNSKIQIRASLTLEGAPISGAAISFTSDNRVIVVNATDEHGIATATFTTPAPALYQLRVHFEGSGELREASAAAALHVIPGR